MDIDENIHPVVVKYEITDRDVKVYEVVKLDREYFDIDHDIRAAIKEEEGNNLNIEL